MVGEILRIETSVIKKNRKSVTMLQQVFLNDTDTLIADAQVTNVFLNINSGKVMPINEELIRLWPDIAKRNQITH